MEQLNRHFEPVYSAFSIVDVLNKFRDDMKKLNMSSHKVWNYFFLNVIALDKHRSQSVKDNVYRLLEKRINARGQM